MFPYIDLFGHENFKRGMGKLFPFPQKFYSPTKTVSFCKASFLKGTA